MSNVILGASIAATLFLSTALASAAGVQVDLVGPAAGDGQVSDDGRYVVFVSSASNLVPGDGNAASDVFVRDTVAHTYERVSVSTTGGDANGSSNVGGMSGDARFVVFSSLATNVVATPVSGIRVYIRDRLNGTTELVPDGGAGLEGTLVGPGYAASADGRFVLFKSASHTLAPGQPGGRLYRYDRVSQTFAPVDVSSNGTPANVNTPPARAQLSADGRFVAFDSIAANLAPGDGNDVPNGGNDIFVRDMVTGITERVSIDEQGQPMVSESSVADISADGRFVVFVSQFGNQDSIYLRDRAAGTTEKLNLAPTQTGDPALIHTLISGNGQRIAYDIQTFPSPGPLQIPKIYIYDRSSHQNVQINLAPDGTPVTSQSQLTSINQDGRFATFFAGAGGIRNVYVAKAPLSTQWHSYAVAMASGSPQATVVADDGSSANIEFYESTNDNGIAAGALFGSFSNSVHPQSFNELAGGIWSTDGFYPYAGKSAVARATGAGESLAPDPLGVSDLQLHPPANNHLTVAAFVAPRSGHYFVSGLAARRVSQNGATIRLHLFDPAGNDVANLQANQSRAWATSSQNFDFGTLQAGDRIYFGVSADGGYEWDASEIAWDISLDSAPPPPQTEIVWNSYDSDGSLPVDYFESGAGYPSPIHTLTTTFATHPESFNHAVQVKTAGSNQLYPYAAHSSVGRQSDTGEAFAPVPAPLGVSDMQLHPPEGTGTTVAAFHVPQTASYSLSNLAVRRVDNHGNPVRLTVYANGNSVTTLTASSDRLWSIDPQSTHSLGTLQAGETVYFAVGNEGDFSFDATEIAWRITATLTP